jgi:hypothetical protein
MLLQEQVVSSGNMVVLVGLNAPLSVLDVEVELVEFLENGLVDWNAVVPHDYSTV